MSYFTVGSIPINNSNFAAGFVTDWVNMAGRHGYYASIRWTAGSPTGTITLEAATDAAGSDAVAISGATDPMAASPAAFNATDQEYPYMRMRWTRTGGAMTGATAVFVRGD